MTKQALVTQLLALARDALKSPNIVDAFPEEEKEKRPGETGGSWRSKDFRAGQYAAYIKASNLVRELDADEWTTH
jgi:hypothetical protein